MAFQDDLETIRWRIHLNAPPKRVYDLLATGEGRARFWAEAAPEKDGRVHFAFTNGEKWTGKVVEASPHRRFAVRYFAESLVVFDLEDDGRGGTDLTMSETGCPVEDRVQQIAGWVSVLLALKGAADFDVDIRNHDPTRTWDRGFADG